MITDLVQIRRLGEKKRDENFRFRAYLKMHYYNERAFRRIAEEIEAGIDCTQCANCCRVAITPIKQRDIDRMAQHLGLSRHEFRERYTEVDEDNDVILKRTPSGCVFLEGNLCSIYDARPSTCASYPHLVRGDGPISTRMWQFVDRASHCPIVYNSLEAFKNEVRFRR